MKIAMLTYSVKPRGGVEHALAVAEALAGRGHDVRVVALAAPGETFFRDTPVATQLIAHVPGDGPFDERILAMVDAYREGLRPLLCEGDFDIVHAQDCLSANAALDLRDEGVIRDVVRTVHHVDDFISPSLIACQDRSILAPDLVIEVGSGDGGHEYHPRGQALMACWSISVLAEVHTCSNSCARPRRSQPKRVRSTWSTTASACTSSARCTPARSPKSSRAPATPIPRPTSPRPR